MTGTPNLYSFATKEFTQDSILASASANSDQSGHPASLEMPAPTKMTNLPLCAA